MHNFLYEEADYCYFWNLPIGFGRWPKRTWLDQLNKDPRFILRATYLHPDRIPEEFHEEFYDRAVEVFASLDYHVARGAGFTSRPGATVRRRNYGMQALTISELVAWNNIEEEKTAPTTRQKKKQRGCFGKRKTRQELIFAQVMRPR